MKNYLTEAIGTFFLVLTIGLCVGQSVALAPVAIGFALAVMVYAGGPISGGHYNPAVSLAAMMRGALPSNQLLPYWVAQLAGALIAAVAVNQLLGVALHVAPSADSSMLRAISGEVLYTFALAYVVLHTATVKSTAGNSYFGLAIGSTVMVGAFSMGGISGGAFNPAVGLGPAVFELVTGKGPSSMAWVVYSVGPLLGGALAATVFKIQRPGE